MILEKEGRDVSVCYKLRQTLLIPSIGNDETIFLTESSEPTAMIVLFFAQLINAARVFPKDRHANYILLMRTSF